MNLREVEKTIKSCLGGTFTGKVAVRIVNGSVVACDVGALGTGMPYLTHAEAMRRVVNLPAPVELPAEVIEADAAVSRARLDFETANDRWLDALNAAERAAIEALPTARQEHLPMDRQGRLESPQLHRADAVLRAATADRDMKADAMVAAGMNAHKVGKRWEERQRHADAERGPQIVGETA